MPSVINPALVPSIVLGSPPKMSDDIFARLREYIYQKTGIYFQDNKKYLLEGRLGKRLQLLNLPGFDHYLDLLKFGNGTNEELRHLYDTITINETFFYRNEPQFEAFEQALIPEIAARKGTNGKSRIRIWSAASSTGEEAYTIGMIFLEKIKPKYPWLDIEIIGTDISPAVLDVARQGIYREYSIRNIPRLYLEKYFTEDHLRWTVREDVRRLVRFDSGNLFDRPKMRSMLNFDVIYCCNVLIYFDTKSKIQVVADLYDSLTRGGFLFIGYAESLHGISTAFKLVNFPKTVVYKKE